MAPKYTPYQRLARVNAKKKKLRDAANEIMLGRMREMMKRDKILYSCLFAYPVIKEFANRTGLTQNGMILLMLTDVFPVLTSADAKLWGINPNKDVFCILTKSLRERGYIEMIGGSKGFRKYFITLKGKQTVKEFNDYYDKYAKKILTYAGRTDYGEIRKITRVRPSTLDKPLNKPSSKKP